MRLSFSDIVLSGVSLSQVNIDVTFGIAVCLRFRLAEIMLSVLDIISCFLSLMTNGNIVRTLGPRKVIFLLGVSGHVKRAKAVNNGFLAIRSLRKYSLALSTVS